MKESIYSLFEDTNPITVKKSGYVVRTNVKPIGESDKNCMLFMSKDQLMSFIKSKPSKGDEEEIFDLDKIDL